MNEPTVTVSFRVAKSVKDQFDQLAQPTNQSGGEWVRDQMMQLLHKLQPGSEPAEPKRESDDSRFAMLQERLHEIQEALTLIRAEIALTAKGHREDLKLLAQVGLNVEELMEQRIDAASEATLDAIERLKQSQRSHKDTVLQALQWLVEDNNEQ